MSEPIINPIIFYFLQVSSTIRSICVIFGTLLAIVLGVFGMAYIVNKCDDEYIFDEDAIPFAKKMLKRGIIIASICFSIFVFAPSKTTITEMILAKNVTYERVENVKDTIQEVYEDIIEIAENGVNSKENREER